MHSRLRDWELRGEPARLGSPRGLVWSLIIAVAFFQITNPRLLIPNFPGSMGVLAVVTGAALVLGGRNFRLPRVPWTIAAYLALCAVSVVWSIDRSDTVQMTILYGWIALFACICVAQTEVQTLLRGISWGGILVVVATLVSLAVNPIKYGHGLLYSGTALGFHGHRGIVAYSVVLALTAALMRKPDSRRLWAVDIGLTITGLLGGVLIAPAANGQVGAICVLIAWVAIQFLRRLHGRALVAGWGAIAGLGIVGAITVILNRDRIFALLGKSSDFTGRFSIWESAVASWLQAPVGGYGFGAVWRYSWWPLGGSRVLERMAEQRQGAFANKPFFHGHNLLIDVLPQLGALGLIGALAILGLIAVRGIKGLSTHSEAPGWALLVFVALIVMGMAEPLLSIPVGWFSATAATAASRAFSSPRRPASYATG